MTSSVRPFVHRSPRYLLRPDDAQVLNFVSSKKDPEKHNTTLYNVSETGLAFVAHRDSAPQVGDRIQIEFPVPGSGRVAWWAKVVRLEAHHTQPFWRVEDGIEDPENLLVAVRFENLPDGHRRAIRQSLTRKFQELQHEERIHKLKNITEFVQEQFWNLILFALCSVAALLALYQFSRYEYLFDVKDGSVYHELFQGLDF